MSAKVLLIEPTIHIEAVAYLSERLEVVRAEDARESTLIGQINGNAVDALITRVECVPRNVIAACPSLRVMGQHGVGLDNIDVSAATANGIMVVNSPHANVPSTAEHAVALMLAVAKRLPRADAAVRAADFGFRERELPRELTGKTLLVVGLGNIGMRVAQICRTAFSMHVLAFDPLLTEERARLLGLTKVDSLGDGLTRADVVTLHVPYTTATHHLIGAEALSQLRDDAILINCARGPVVDEDALVDTLEQGRIAGAGLDVFEREPPAPDSALLGLPNVVLTPHFAGDTAESKRRCSFDLAKDVIRALDGAMPQFLVNPDVLFPLRTDSNSEGAMNGSQRATIPGNLHGDSLAGDP